MVHARAVWDVLAERMHHAGVVDGLAVRVRNAWLTVNPAWSERSVRTC